MARNGTGTYVLPQPAFVAQTKISSSVMNSQLSDIASALTQSLSADGQTPLTGPLLMPNGTAGAPGVTFLGDKTTGFYLVSAGQIGWTASGVQAATFNADKSVTWGGGASWAGNITVNGTTTLAGAVTLNNTSFTFGAGAANALWAGLLPTVDITCIIDGGGTVILAGSKGQYHIPCSLTITAWRVMADQAGRIVIDGRRANDGIPSVSIVGGGNKPTLSGVGFNEVVPNGWTATTLVKDDWIDFNVTGTPSSVTRVTVVLSCQRTSNS